MTGPLQPGLLIIPVNAGLLLGLLFFGSTRRTRAAHADAGESGSALQVVIGFICLILAGLNIAFAFEWPGWLPAFAGLEPMPRFDLYVSAFCYAVCGALLLSAGTGTPRKNSNPPHGSGRART